MTMKTLKRALAALLPLLLLAAGASAQTPPSGPGPMYAPNWYQGYEPTPFQWTVMWSNKLDYFPAGLPIKYGGCGATTVQGCLTNLGIPSLALTSGQMFVGNSVNQVAAVTPSGDWSISNLGVNSVNHLNHVTDGSLANSGLTHSSLTINGNSVALGGSTTVTAAAASVAPGTTTVSPNTNPNGLLWNSAGIVQSLASSNYGALYTGSSGTPAIGKVLLVSVQAAFQAACDGTTDDTSKINTALAAGVALTSGGATCAVSGNVTLPDGTWLEDVKFKQLTPNSASRRTLVISGGVGPITLINVTVNRNGSTTDSTTPTSAAAVWVAGSSSGGVTTVPIKNVYIQDLEVYGDGPGQGLVVTDAQSPRIVRPHVHDMNYSTSVDPCTEQLYGIFLIRTVDVYLEEPWVEALGGTIAAGVPSGACASQANFTASIAGTTMTVTAVSLGTLSVNQLVNAAAGNVASHTQILSQLTGPAGGTGTYQLNNSQTVSSEAMTSGGTGSWSAANAFRYYQTDGMDGGGVVGMTMVGGYFKHVGEGTDFGGSLGGNNIIFVSPRYVGIDSHGLKLNDGITNFKAVGGSCADCGFNGALVSSSSVQTAHVVIQNWTSYNTGSNGNWAEQVIAGVSEFDSVSGVSDFTCSFCTTVDKQVTPTTKYGFRNQTGTATSFRLDHPSVDVSGGAFIGNYQNFTNGILEQTSAGNVNVFGTYQIGGNPMVADVPSFHSTFLGAYPLPTLSSTNVGTNTECAGIYGSNNLGIGVTALQSMRDGCNNLAIGYLALSTAQHEQLSTAIGYQVLQHSEATDGVTSQGENTGLGYGALSANTTGYYNTALGSVTLQNNTTGKMNIAVGSHAMLSNTTGNNNSALGYNALNLAVTAGNNSAFGYSSLTAATGSNNSAFGSETLEAAGSFTDNTAVGRQAGQNTTGSDNTLIGFQVQQAATSAQQVTLVGSQAAIANTASNTTGVGYKALNSNTSGTNNSAFGSLALASNSTGSANTAVGYEAAQGSSLTSTGVTAVGFQAGQLLAGNASYNTLIGYASGNGITSGTNNTLIGASQISTSYNQVTTGSNNIAIGKDVAVASATASNQLVIGNYVYGTGLSGTGASISSGKIGIGTNAPATELEVAGTLTVSGTGAGNFTGTVTVGTGATRNLSMAASGGNYTGTTTRYDGNGLTTLETFQNYGITATNDGLSRLWKFGTGGSFGANAAAIDVMATADWSSGANQSSQFRFRCSTAGSLSACLTMTTATATFPNAVSLGTSLTTGNPSGGTAQPWKLGSLVTSTTCTAETTKYVQIDINGTAVKVATCQ